MASVPDNPISDQLLTGGATGVAEVCDVVHRQGCWLCKTLAKDTPVSPLSRQSIILVSKKKDSLGSNPADLCRLCGGGKEIRCGNNVASLRVCELVHDLIKGIRVIDGGDDATSAKSTEDRDSKVVLPSKNTKRFVNIRTFRNNDRATELGYTTGPHLVTRVNGQDLTLLEPQAVLQTSSKLSGLQQELAKGQGTTSLWVNENSFAGRDKAGVGVQIVVDINRRVDGVGIGGIEDHA